MSDYQSRADMMRTWTVAEVKAQPHLAVGQLHSAAAIIEKLMDEVERLNRENFWLTQQEPVPDMTKGRTIQLPPVELGDTVWLVKRDQGCVSRCRVCRIEIHGSKVRMVTKSRGCGVYGEDLFLTKEEAQKALEVGNG